MIEEFSDFVVYVDESGDANLDKINQNFPAFVLTFCIFNKKEYSFQAIPKLNQLKFKYFGHDMVVLHEREINKRIGAFSAMSQKARTAFLEELTGVIDTTQMTIIAIVIKKNDYKSHYLIPNEPYSLAMRYGLERLYHFLKDQSGNQHLKKTFVICESRGKKEDNELELAFRRICDGTNYLNLRLNFEVHFAAKAVNSTGLQLADLTARPIGQYVLKPDQPNRTYKILEKKFRSNSGEISGFGLKIVP